MLGDALEKRAKIAQGTRADDIALVGQDVDPRLIVAQGYVEVIEPEVGQDLPELVLGIHRSQ